MKPPQFEKITVLENLVYSISLLFSPFCPLAGSADAPAGNFDELIKQLPNNLGCHCAVGQLSGGVP